MTEKMTITKAREIPLKHMSNQNQECRCHLCDRCDGFIEGYESRQAEIEELKKKISNRDEALELLSYRVGSDLVDEAIDRVERKTK